jgi:hypothetical protein
VSNPRIWTVEEANSMLPRLSSLIGRQLAAGAEIERGWRRLVGLLGPGRSGVEEGASGRAEQLLLRARSSGPEARALERQLSEKIAAYEAGWREVQDLGVAVKDPRIGLCDFYGRVDGRLVWLCWRYGEQAVAHYHELDAGYAGRKALTAEQRQLLLN